MYPARQLRLLETLHTLCGHNSFPFIANKYCLNAKCFPPSSASFLPLSLLSMRRLQDYRKQRLAWQEQDTEQCPPSTGSTLHNLGHGSIRGAADGSADICKLNRLDGKGRRVFIPAANAIHLPVRFVDRHHTFPATRFHLYSVNNFLKTNRQQPAGPQRSRRFKAHTRCWWGPARSRVGIPNTSLMAPSIPRTLLGPPRQTRLRAAPPASRARTSVLLLLPRLEMAGPGPAAPRSPPGPAAASASPEHPGHNDEQAEHQNHRHHRLLRHRQHHGRRRTDARPAAAQQRRGGGAAAGRGGPCAGSTPPSHGSRAARSSKRPRPGEGERCRTRRAAGDCS